MNFLRSLLSDSHNGAWSSKRFVTFSAFILCSVAFIASVFFEKKIDLNLFNSMMYIVIAGLGFTASEKFVSNK